MLTILELQEKDKLNKTLIEKLKVENNRLKSEEKSSSVLRKISMKKIIPKTNALKNMLNKNWKFKTQNQSDGKSDKAKKFVKNAIKIKTNKSVLNDSDNSLYYTREDSNIQSKFEEKIKKLNFELENMRYDKEDAKIKLRKIATLSHNQKGKISIESNPEIQELTDSIKNLDIKIKIKEAEKSKVMEQHEHYNKGRSVSPGNVGGGFKMPNKVPQNVVYKSIIENRDISPFKINDSSFFSNINDISQIKYQTNKSNEHNNFKNLDQPLKELITEADEEKRLEKARNMKAQLQTNQAEFKLKLAESTGSYESDHIIYKDQTTSPKDKISIIEDEVKLKVTEELKLQYEPRIDDLNMKFEKAKYQEQQIKHKYESQLKQQETIHQKELDMLNEQLQDKNSKKFLFEHSV